MDLSFTSSRADGFKSGSQRIKNLSEDWVGRSVYCPGCGEDKMERYGNNKPVADFFCPSCEEDYELKSQGRPLGTKLVDGAYRTMIDRLQSSRNPNLLVLQYRPLSLSVLNLLVIPKQFFVPRIIEERKPLGPTARRAGWIGCTINLRAIPESGRIHLIKNTVIEPKNIVLATWKKTIFLREQQDTVTRNWLLSVMKCVEDLKKPVFTVDEVYRYENEMQDAFPANRHIRAKIRQQLQVLRDKGYLEFTGRGNYRLANATSN